MAGAGTLAGASIGADGAVAAAGADWLVAGSAAFKGGRGQYAANIAALRQAAESAIGLAA